MKRLLSLSLFALCSLRAVADPAIAFITPDRGSTAGGTEVTISGSDLLPTIQCILPCPATVTFGDITVTVKSETHDRLVVVTPPHAAGPVSVVVKVSGEEPVKLADAFTYEETIEDQYERVLLPVYVDGVANGQGGAQWKTDLWIRNNGKGQVFLAPWPCETEVCPPVFPWSKLLAPGESVHNLPKSFKAPSANPGTVLWLTRPESKDVSFNLRFADTARASVNGGTELPVIRESEFLTAPAQLMNVPLNVQFRVLLRIYDVTYTSSRFRIHFYPQSETDQAEVHSVDVVASTLQTGEFRTEPAYAQFDVTELLRMERVWPANLRIAVEPLEPGSRYWAFASVTNNETQLVTLITPQ